MFGKHMLAVPIVAVVAVAAVAVPVCTGSVLVDWTGAGDCTTISEGIAAADSSDTVWVAPGVYAGPANRALDFLGKEIVLLSLGGRGDTVIDAKGEDRVFNLVSEMTAATVISGFTIRNGYAENGGGIWVGNYASPTITDCRIENCEATDVSGGGGGMACSIGSPTLIDVVFSGNQAQYGGGLMPTFGSVPSLTRVRFEGNEAHFEGGGCYYNGFYSQEEMALTDCTFYDNNCPGSGGGGGLYLRQASPILTGCTFAWNSAPNSGACIYLDLASPTIENSVLSFSQIGSALYPPSATPTITRSIVYSNQGGDWLPGAPADTLIRDPRFCDVFSGNLTLCQNSWALPENNDWIVLMGAHEKGCGPCPSPVESSSWGRVKALYR